MRLLLGIKLVLGFVALGMGGIGLFVPVWPTTPFVLLALGCFSGAPRLRAQMLRVRFVRDYYESRATGRRLPLQTLVVSLVFLWGMLLLSMAMMQKPMVAIGLAVVGFCVTGHLLWMAKNRKKRPTAPERLHDDA